MVIVSCIVLPIFIDGNGHLLFNDPDPDLGIDIFSKHPMLGLDKNLKLNFVTRGIENIESLFNRLVNSFCCLPCFSHD